MNNILLFITCMLLFYIIAIRRTFFSSSTKYLLDVLVIEMDAAQIEMHNRINDTLSELGATYDQIDYMWELLHQAVERHSTERTVTPVTAEEMHIIRVKAVGKDIHQKMLDRGY